MFDIKLIQQKIKEENYQFSYHAEVEKGADKISIREIEEAVLNGEIIEDYPENKRGRSLLIAGFTRKNRPVHAVCGNLEEEKNKPANQRSEFSLIEKLNFVIENNFKRVSYTEAIEILKHSKPNKKKKFQYLITEWGVDLQSEHERYLVESHFKCPVILFDYPANIKAFYMRLNEDGKTVRAMDVLFPGIGEIVGGSQREERLDVLLNKIQALGIDEKELWWYLDTRRFGTAIHSGFGLGFERLVQFATGMGNIRDVIPFPRTPQNAEF